MDLPKLRIVALLFSAAMSMLAFAQAEKSDHYGGLGDYKVPQADGGVQEFQFCFLYAQRAWRVANMLDMRTLYLAEVRQSALDNLGRLAAQEEISDFDAFADGKIRTPEALGAERFVRCASTLKLKPEPRHYANAEFCFRSLRLLDYAATQRSSGRTREQVASSLTALGRSASKRFVDSTVELAFAGLTLNQGSTLIEDTFAECFAQAGERQGRN
jgi:hypothetical protein